MIKRHIITLILVLSALAALTAAPQGRHGRPYTEADPLVMVCDWSFPPYELNKNGTPTGYCVEVMDAILNKLEIPHRFEMRDWTKAIEAFESGQADMIHALDVVYDKPPYVQTQNFMTFYKIEVAYRDDTPPLRSLKQLTSKDTIVVKNNDYAAVYLNQQEYRPYHVRYENPHDALVALSNGEIKYYLWGSMPLRQEIQEMALDNVRTCDVDIPTGELHFTSTDEELINDIDEEFARMMQEGELEVITDKWFHPERIHHNTPRYVFFIIGLVVMLIIVFMILSHLLRRQIRKKAEKTRDLGNIMAQALSMGRFYVIENELATGQMKNVYGNLIPEEGMDVEEFFDQIAPSDEEHIRSVYGHLLKNAKQAFDLDLKWNGRQLRGNSIAEMEGDQLTHNTARYSSRISSRCRSMMPAASSSTSTTACASSVYSPRRVRHTSGRPACLTRPHCKTTSTAPASTRSTCASACTTLRLASTNTWTSEYVLPSMTRTTCCIISSPRATSPQSVRWTWSSASTRRSCAISASG